MAHELTLVSECNVLLLYVNYYTLILITANIWRGGLPKAKVGLLLYVKDMIVVRTSFACVVPVRVLLIVSNDLDIPKLF